MKEKHASKLLAMQQIIMLNADKVITTWVMSKISELKEQKPDLRYDEISHVIIKLIEDINKPENEKLFMSLASIVYTESEETEIKIDEKSLDNFVAEAKEYVTVERMIKILDDYNPSDERLNSILDGVRMMNEISTGEAYEVVNENPEESKVNTDEDICPTAEVK
ncbi:MAG: hypothetical protein ACRCX2_33470 [Paraclostridium sp.]